MYVYYVGFNKKNFGGPQSEMVIGSFWHVFEQISILTIPLTSLENLL